VLKLGYYAVLKLGYYANIITNILLLAEINESRETKRMRENKIKSAFIA